MKDYFKVSLFVLFVAFILSLPIIFYSSLVYIAVHFLKKFW